MNGFTPTNWELSNRVAQTKTIRPLSEGEHVLRVVDSQYDYDTQRYKLKLRSFTNEGEESTLTFFLAKKDGSQNDRAVATLNAIAFAMSGNRETILSPEDMLNRFFCAPVVLGAERMNNYGEMVRYPEISEGVRALTKDELSRACARLLEMGEEVVREQFYTD